MFTDWQFEHFVFAGLMALMVCLLIVGGWSSVENYEMAKLGYVQKIEPVTTTNGGLSYVILWVPRDMATEKK